MTDLSLIAFDVGNSAVKCAVRRAAGWEVVFRVATHPIAALGDRIAEALTACAGRLPAGPRRWLASSVFPDADRALFEDCRRRGVPGPEVFGRDLPIPIPALVRHPERVGADRLLCALGARELFGAPCITVGAGTAITVDLVDAEGRFAGGAIAPGFGLAARALHEAAARLPLVDPQPPPGPVGRDTEEAIRSGVEAFCCGGAAALVSAMAAEPGAGGHPTVVLTGGDAGRLTAALRPCAGRFEVVPDLIFHGMSAALDGV